VNNCNATEEQAPQASDNPIIIHQYITLVYPHAPGKIGYWNKGSWSEEPHGSTYKCRKVQITEG